MSLIRQQLLDIQASQDFTRLNELITPDKWHHLEDNDRILLAKIASFHAINELKSGNSGAVHFLDQAQRISSDHPEILHMQASALSTFANNIHCLKTARVIYEKLLKLSGKTPLICGEIGKVLFDMSLHDLDINGFAESENYFKEAILLADSLEKNKDDFLVDMHWKWGKCLAVLARLDGEPHDYREVLHKFDYCLRAGFCHADFFNDVGEITAELGLLLAQPDYLQAALKHFNSALELDTNGFRTWYNRACCLHRLYEPVFDSTIFELANQGYAYASKLDPSHSGVWLSWGILLLSQGKHEADLVKVEEAIAHFSKANERGPIPPLFVVRWSEAELFIGSQEEQLEYLKAAKERVFSVIQSHPEMPQAWCQMGDCLIELGDYFDDSSFYRQAIEQFEQGLRQTSEQSMLFYGLGRAHFFIGLEKLSIEDLEKALNAFESAVKGSATDEPQFWNDWGLAFLKYGELTDSPELIEQAIERFEIALKHPIVENKIKPMNLESLYHLGCAYDLLGDIKDDYDYFEKSIHILSQLVELNADDHHARDNLALAYFHLGSAVTDVNLLYKSLEHFQILLEKSSDDDVIHLNYAIALMTLGELLRDQHHKEESFNFFHTTESHLVRALSLGNRQALYLLASLYTLQGLYQEAIYYLEKAHFNQALPPLNEMMEDEWLADLRKTKGFQYFLDEILRVNP